MAIQKVSDLPIFRKNDPDFNYGKVKASLIEMSYKISSDDTEGVSKYQSKAVTVAELADYILSAQTGDGIFSGNIMFPNGFSLSGSVYLNQPVDDDIVETYVVSAKTGAVDTTALLRYKVNSPTIEMSCSSFTVNADGRAVMQAQGDSMVIQPRTEFKNRVFVPAVDESSDDKCAVDLGYLRRSMPEIKSPFILFETKYLDYSSPELSSSGWINTTAGQWLSAADFPNAYEHLYLDYTSDESRDYSIQYRGFNKTVTAKKAKDGHIVCSVEKISDVNAIFNALGVAWTYVIDSANRRFMLPRNNVFIRGCSGGTSDTVGGYSPPILPLHSHSVEYNVVKCDCSVNGGIGSSHSGPASSAQTIGMSLDSTATVQAGNTVSPAAVQMYLYMYCS